MLEVQVGPAHLPGGETLVLRVGKVDPVELRTGLHDIVQSLAPGAPTTLTTHYDRPLEVNVHWRDPAGLEHVSSLVAGGLVLENPQPGVYLYHLVWMARSVGAELRIPESPRRFRLEVGAASRNVSILDGTGNARGVFGETIPIWIRVDRPEKVRSATLHSRSSESSDVSSHPMKLVDDPQRPGTFEARVARPVSRNARLNYWIVLEDTSGLKADYASEATPHTVEPQEPALDR